MSMACDVSEWGTAAYSLDTRDFLREIKGILSVKGVDEVTADKDAEDADAPYFSLVTGRYESRRPSKEDEDVNLRVFPGQGKLTNYSSAASDFLQSREYQGLVVAAGETAAKAAVKGQTGIASNYEER